MPPSPAPRSPSPRPILLLGLGFGLLVGVVEGLAVIGMILLVPGSVSWRSANGPEILLIAPFVNGAAFAVLAVPFAIGALFARSVRWDLAYVTVAGVLAGYLGITLPGPFIYRYAVVLASLGAGAAAFQVWRARGSWILEHLGRLTMGLVAVPLVAFPLIVGAAKWRERRATAVEATPRGPNILLLVLDTQRADHLGLYGYRRPTSPTLDSLGRAGLVFDHAIAGSSWTLPSHATIMTGRLQHEHRAGLLRQPLLDGQWPTIAEALSGAGYATGGFVANTFWAGRRTGLDRGFGHYSDYYRNPADAIARTTIGRAIYYSVLPRFGQVDIPGRRRATQLNGDLLDWIDALHGRPFFAFLNYLDVHPPLLPPAPERGRFSSSGQLPPVHEIDVGALTGAMHLPSPQVIADRLNRYDESILAWDAALAGLLRGLVHRGLDRNTLIVITSDHGEGFGEHGLFSHGHSLYADQIDVPLVLWWPSGIPAPHRVASPVGLDQLAVTLARVGGLAGNQFPGRSLLDPEPSPGFAISEVARRAAASLGWPSSAGWVAGVVSPEWRYLLRQDGAGELYAAADSGERTNRSADPSLASVADSLRRMITRSGIPEGLLGRRPSRSAPADR